MQVEQIFGHPDQCGAAIPAGLAEASYFLLGQWKNLIAHTPEAPKKGRPNGKISKK